MDFLNLKWGNLKGWFFSDDRTIKLEKQLRALESSYRRKFKHTTAKQKRIICAIIDSARIEKVYLDWDINFVSKAEAKSYVQNYGTETQRRKKQIICVCEIPFTGMNLTCKACCS